MITSTIISTILGLLTALLPRVFSFLETRQKSKDLAVMNQHELKMFELQTERLEKAADLRLRELDAEYAGQANLAVYDFARPTSGWTALLSEFVRPFITLIFTALFVSKIAATLSFVLGMNYNPGPNGNVVMAVLDAFIKGINAVWDERTHDLFVTTIVFWFGDRAMRKKGL